MIFSAIKGKSSKPDSIQLIAVKGSISLGEFSIAGDQAKYFRIISPKPKKISSKAATTIALIFEPDESFIGIARASLALKGLDRPIGLTGLSTKALEGENEAPLSRIVEALGYTTDVGWATLSNHLRPALQGEELAPALFKKAKEGKVEMIPVARYSPDFLLNFGYYTPSVSGPRQYQSGVLATAGKFPEHQTLFPKVAAGGTSFDPGNTAFGFYAISPGHTVYSEDIWNILFYPKHATHAMRIYPIRLKNGGIQEGSYLVCMEEAANGDYNDYVFIVHNVTPVFQETEFIRLLNGENLDGWYTWLLTKGKNSDPENIFSIEDNGILHDEGKEVGYIMTERSFKNFHLTVEFKWGEKRYPPRDSSKRDSGICYNVPADEPDHIWPQSVECQIQEGDVGDFWLLGNSTIQVDGKQNHPSAYTQIVKTKDAENKYGEWNTVEVISFHGKCVHIVNGVVVNYGENASLIGGRILLQSEYAEIYYKNVKIREL